MDMSKYREMFLSESREHLKKMSRLLIALEKNPADREGIDALFREAHSVKGMAASMGYERTAELAHHLEDLMDGFRSTGAVPPPAVDHMLEGLDLLEGLLGDVAAEHPEREVAGFIAGQGKTSPAPAADPPPRGREQAKAPAVEPEGKAETRGAEAARSWRIVATFAEGTVAPAARALLALRGLAALGTVTHSEPGEEALKKGASPRALEVRLQSGRAAEEIEKTLQAMSDIAEVSLVEVVEPAAAARTPRRGEGHRTVRVRTDLLDTFINLTGELLTSRYMLQAAAQAERWKDLSGGLDQLARLVTDLHHHVLQVRMTPLESITGRLPRLVRDLERKTGKQVALRIEGEEVELDRAILEELADPLVHMVRNAVDHGIEERGEVQVRATREKDLVLLEVADNGRGMDPEAIRRKAQERGLLSAAQARGMRERDLLQLVCHPGFSTAEQVTETSGRGVGMDVVKSAVESLGGSLEIQSQQGRGSRMLVKLPLSVAIIQILLVESDGFLVGLPITKVQRTLEVTREEIRSSGRQLVIRLGDEMLPLLSLRKILRQPNRPFGGGIQIVVSEIRGRRVGLVVDRLAGQREVFVKALEYPLNRLPGVSGATVLGDGSILFIIDPQTMLDERPAGVSAAAPGEAR
ncbi:chemotaxis protein CheA [Desulfuromonas versatilis]|uniref:Chemotaxis protein CheA n=1 Tax=Desulfuromonas versatilis TaxID=2802975 RepID=A0ABM8HY05_9BACT|nr:chemotaxis protein CheA [Desulfuromonas versatilis]BCR06862.1 chemotaxis protein CheA [Desulfuromonas versatilis]